MKKVTVREIALQCGCSPATVSRVLNRRGLVSDSVREKVERVIRTSHYRHSAYARQNIAIICSLTNGEPRFPYGFYPSMVICELSGALYRRGFSLMVLGERDLDLITPDRFGGAVSLTFSDRISERWGREQPIPLVMINSPRKMNDQVFSIVSNDAGGIRMAVEYLKRHGHRRIGMLSMAGRDSWTGEQRVAAFLQTVEEFRLANCPVRRVLHFENLGEELGILLHSGITALVIPNEGIGHCASEMLALYRLRIPEDISLISWEARGVSEHWVPPLTTIGQNFSAIADAAAENLIAFHEGRPTAREISIDCVLTERASVRSL